MAVVVVGWLTGSVGYSQTSYEAYYFSLFAGGVGLGGSEDGALNVARFRGPEGIARDASGFIYLADTGNSIIRAISPAGTVSTVAGLAGNTGFADGTGSAARFSFPRGIGVDTAGNIYVADTSNHTIRKITSAGVVTTFAGAAGQSGSADGAGATARFFFPIGVALDGSNNVYVVDDGNQTIRMITPAGVVTTLAGSAGNAGANDGAGNMARFFFPTGIAYDATGGVLYVADTSNQTVRKVTLGGAVTTVAGTPSSAGSTDGTGSAALFNGPAGITVDVASNVYISELNNHTIRKIRPSGLVTTLGGFPGQAGNADEVGSRARFNAPRALVIDSTGRLTVADTNNQTLRLGVPAAGGISLVISPGATGHKVVSGHTFPNVQVTITATGSLGSAFLPLVTVSSDGTGFFQYDDTASGRRFYRATLSGS